MDGRRAGAAASRSPRRAAWLTGVAAVVALFAAPALASASTPFVDIHSAGPLSDIYIGNDLSCQVRNGGFSSTEYFPNASGPGDCGTFLFIGAGPASAAGFWGPDFANHPGGTDTTGHFSTTEVPFTPVSQSFTGSGTTSSPYQVTTIVDAGLNLSVTEVDTYVAGDNFYQTDFTVSNTSPGSSVTGELYRAADCQLRGNDNGFAIAFTQTAACASAPPVTGSPLPPFEKFDAVTPPNSSWTEDTNTNIWSDLNGSVLPDSVNSGDVNNGEAMAWNISSLQPGSSQTFSFKTKVVDTVPAGGFSLSGSTTSAANGMVATITDPNTSATPSAYSATIDWGDGGSSAGTITAGSGAFDVAGSHMYAAPGTYPVSVTITSGATNLGSSTVTDTATITAPPTPVVTGTPPSVGSHVATLTGSVDPAGLPTDAFFEYGLDPKYFGGGPVVYTQSTPAQAVGSDFTSHNVTASVSGLVPNALYHVRLVAQNSDGTTFGPDVTFRTRKAPPPKPPTLGKTFNVAPVSGFALVKLHGQLIPITQVEQIRAHTLIDSLRGTIKLIAALSRGSRASDAAAKGKKHKGKKTKTQTGTFGGAIFKITQARNGLATLALVENAFNGAPSYAVCKAHKAADASAARLSSRTLQLLRSSAHGKFRTTGHYSAATVRGTKWTIADRCDGTFIHDVTDSVVVRDFVHHKTIILHAGQTYLAKAPKHK